VPDTLEISRSAIASVAAGRGIVATGDALLDPTLGIQESVRRLRIRSLVAAPIRRGSEVIGALYLDHRETPHLFREDDVLFVQFIAEMAAIGIHNARTFEHALGDADRLRSALEDRPYSVPGTVFRAPAMRRVVERAVEAARKGGVILLLGPTGAGKDHMARAIHRLSGRTGSFVHCPLPLITETLGPSQLFGIHGRIATEVDPRPGFVEQAQDGTLFLNEIADAPPAVQAALLQLLEGGAYERLGEEGRARSLNALLICATNADLRARVEEGTFRRDLYYRIAGRTITLPPLRERAEDIPDLVEHFIDEWALESGRRPIPTPRAMELLLRCPWEGNVRELRTCILNACENAEHGVIDVDHLSSPTLATLGDGDGLARPGIERTLDLVRIQNIREALAESGGIVSRAAAILQVKESTLRRWIDELRLKHLTTRRWGKTRP
jgi:Nif-specific regulatory protein